MRKDINKKKMIALKNIPIKSLSICFILLIALMPCLGQKKCGSFESTYITINTGKDTFSTKINKSINHRDISSIILYDSLQEMKTFVGFFNDGITPSYISRRKNGEHCDRVLRFFPTGLLNQSYSFNEGKLNGWYLIYNEDGILIYKAFYEKGILTLTEINELQDRRSIFVDDIDSLKN